MKHYVDIIKYSTGESVKRMEAESERAAERIARGVGINLNHEEYYVEVTPA